MPQTRTVVTTAKREIAVTQTRLRKIEEEIAELQLAKQECETILRSQITRFVTTLTLDVRRAPSEIEAVLADAARETSDGKRAARGVSIVHEPDDPEMQARDELDGGSQPAAAGGIRVRVRISRNCRGENRAILDDRGLRWHGRSGRWRGDTDAAGLAALREVLGHRVEVDANNPGPAADGGVEEPGPTEPDPDDGGATAVAAPQLPDVEGAAAAVAAVSTATAAIGHGATDDGSGAADKAQGAAASAETVDPRNAPARSEGALRRPPVSSAQLRRTI